LGEWWFAGMPISETVDWFPYSHPLTGGADITNQFISFGLSAGLGAIILSIVLLKRAFTNVGMALRAVRSNSEPPGENEFLLWGLGVLIATHIITWLGITYYDQFYVVWFMQLAAISSVSASCINMIQLESKQLQPVSEEPDSPEPGMAFGQPLLEISAHAR
jgi:hypothetical protein